VDRLRRPNVRGGRRPRRPASALAVPRTIEFTPTRESTPLTFLDLPDLAAALARAAEFRLLTSTELDGPIDISE
jgi:hypothetical protein